MVGVAKSFSFDWENVHNNQFTIIRQFRVDCPQDTIRARVISFLILFYLWMDAIGCRGNTNLLLFKSLSFKRWSIGTYTNQRFEAGEAEQKVMKTYLLLINYWLQQALMKLEYHNRWFGWALLALENDLSWKTICEKLGVSQLSEQQRLVQGFLSQNLLDLVRHFVINQTGGRLINSTSLSTICE